MIRVDLEVENSLGVHMRPAGKIVKLCSSYRSEIFFHRNGMDVNAKSVLGVLSLAADQGSMIGVSIDGTDEAEAIEALRDLFAGGFGEESA